jgi:hypothetical protein
MVDIKLLAYCIIMDYKHFIDLSQEEASGKSPFLAEIQPLTVATTLNAVFS